MSPLLWPLWIGALGLANFPFLSERVFGLWRVSPRKSYAWIGLEWGCGLGATLLLGRGLEALQGPVFAQQWTFFVVMVCLFLIAAFPGFVYRTLWPKAKRAL